MSSRWVGWQRGGGSGRGAFGEGCQCPNVHHPPCCQHPLFALHIDPQCRDSSKRLMDLSCWMECNHRLKLWRENLLCKKSRANAQSLSWWEGVGLFALSNVIQQGERGGHDFFNSSFPFLALNVIVGSS